MNIKEEVKIKKYLSLLKELKQLCNARVTVISDVIGIFGKIPKDPEKKSGGIGNKRKNGDYTWLRKGSLERETEFLPIVAQNNAIRTNYAKAKIDKTQQNSKRMVIETKL